MNQNQSPIECQSDPNRISIEQKKKGIEPLKLIRKLSIESNGLEFRCQIEVTCSKSTLISDHHTHLNAPLKWRCLQIGIEPKRRMVCTLYFQQPQCVIEDE